MGGGDKPIHFLLAFAGVWPILLNTAAGVRNLDPRWLQLAHSLSATRWEVLRRVVLPGVHRPDADRGAPGHRHPLDRAGALRNARRQRRLSAITSSIPATAWSTAS
ncbi:hypothetical protein J2W58_001737 [Pseudomonas psychrotolerans]|nr:hypothetical protein [Pseudomonas psychrotolerans]